MINLKTGILYDVCIQNNQLLIISLSKINVIISTSLINMQTSGQNNNKMNHEMKCVWRMINNNDRIFEGNKWNKRKTTEPNLVLQKYISLILFNNLADRKRNQQVVQTNNCDKMEICIHSWLYTVQRIRHSFVRW